MLLVTAIIQSKQDQDMYMDRHTFALCASIFVAILVMLFILFILKLQLEQRIKERILDKGVSEELAKSILNAKTTDIQHSNSRWFMVLSALGAGLMIVYYTSPLGIHSLAIMSFCIALGFLGHYLFIKHKTR